MAELIAEFFLITGLDAAVPQTLGELIPYALNIFVGVSLVSGVFAVLGKLVDVVLDFTRWR